ncbi:MAG: hypothetical protein PVJ67_04120 [Candidatus Pacearchaeota archaeon]|jgi:hypothetical protein
MKTYKLAELEIKYNELIGEIKTVINFDYDSMGDLKYDLNIILEEFEESNEK